MIRWATSVGTLVVTLTLSTGSIGAEQVTIKKGSIKPTPSGSGEGMYKAYCAVCHGETAKGDGPAVPALKTAPPDLTMLMNRNGGVFPGERVMMVLRSGVEEPAHGTKEMPIWGPLFGSLGGRGQASPEVQQRIFNLTKYIESLQSK